MTDSTTLVLGATSLALVVVLYVWFALALAAMFRKIGAPAWKAWIPVLNVATLLALGGFSPWLVLLNLVPLFGFIAFFIVLVVAMHRLTVGFGGGAGLTVVGALFPVVWASILGFGSARWEGDRPIDEDSVPVRRGQDFQGPYVPLMGGWTPDESPDRRADDDVARPDAPAVSEPVVLPFAAPSGSLADAVPSPSDWAPPADLQPAHPGARRSAESPAVDEPRDAPLPAGSVFEVLDALRDGSPADRYPADGSPSGRGPASERDAESPAPSAALRPQGDPAAPTTDIPAPLSSGRSTPAPVDDAAETRALLLPGSPTRGMPSWTPSAPEPASVEGESARSDDGDDAAPWADPPRRTPHSDAERSAPIAEVPLTRPAPEPLPAPRAAHSPVGDEFPELSEAVSAVSEAPDAGAPRSARTSVSALYTRPEVPADPDDFDALDRTVVTRRKRIPWVLIPPNGTTVDLASTVVILGRRPSADAAHPDAQLVPIVDETRTVSKTHARLELRGDTWYVTDLDSTNGVLFATLMGTEVEAPPGEEIEAGERFYLGDAEVRLTRREV